MPGPIPGTTVSGSFSLSGRSGSGGGEGRGSPTPSPSPTGRGELMPFSFMNDAEGEVFSGRRRTSPARIPSPLSAPERGGALSALRFLFWRPHEKAHAIRQARCRCVPGARADQVGIAFQAPQDILDDGMLARAVCLAAPAFRKRRKSARRGIDVAGPSLACETLAQPDDVVAVVHVSSMSRWT